MQYRILNAPVPYTPYSETANSSGNLRYPYTVKKRESSITITQRRYPHEPQLTSGDMVNIRIERGFDGLYEVTHADYRKHQGSFENEDDAIDAHATVDLKLIKAKEAK